MIVSRQWLLEYIPLELPVEVWADRLTMSGCNLESIEPSGQDYAVDLEITSNRADCLGHLGIARELSVLLDAPFSRPGAMVEPVADLTESVTSVELQCPEMCPQYMARVMRGVKVGPSPDWMIERLQTVFPGYKPINNIVDITNYVMMECGQPLHAFDFDKLAGKKIVVRRAKTGEKLAAINHIEYALTPEMCVIADAEKPVAIAGVMGGAETEITAGTVNVLIETANFTPLSVRNAARSLKLQSPSSYRFERQIDIQQLDWASRRCCELIQQLAGGELLDEPIVEGDVPDWNPEPITLRFARVEAVLGIRIPVDECVRILTSLGLPVMGKVTGESAKFRPPSWRRDLTREIDLIEEIIRIHGYDNIPEDRPIPVVSGSRSTAERVRERIEHVLTAAGFNEALTFSFVTEELAKTFVRDASLPDLVLTQAAGEFGNRARATIIPSLLAARRENERQGNLTADLYEIARVFLGTDPSNPATQPLRVALITGRSFFEVKGVLEAVARAVNPTLTITAQPSAISQFTPGRGAELSVAFRSAKERSSAEPTPTIPWGVLGEVDRTAPNVRDLKLREPATIAEFDLQPLIDHAVLVAQAQPLPDNPAVTRDLNLVLDEAVTWSALEAIVKGSAGPHLEHVRFVDQYRGKHIPTGKKSYVFSMSLRAADRTLTSEEIDAVQASVLKACESGLGAALRG
jgi:phenylalanyl-tRNA synthetase beta chain